MTIQKRPPLTSLQASTVSGKTEVRYVTPKNFLKKKLICEKESSLSQKMTIYHKMSMS